jgi:CubicO group peptidase (beta-lactamase class C family)
MKQLLALAFCLLAMLCLLPSEHSPRRAAAPAPREANLAEALSRFTAWVEARRASHGLPGVTVGIIRDQRLVWARGFGLADAQRGVPATGQTLYRLSSISKLFTALAILQLRDQGKLKLDDPVGEHLSWFHWRDPRGRDITIRQLLTHTAGLPRDPAGSFWDDFRFPTRTDIRTDLLGVELTFAPGTRWKYSNLGYALLGEVVAARSGMPFEKYVEKQILGPLGMSRTSVTPVQGAQTAVGYGRRQGTRRQARPWSEVKGLAPAAGVASSVEDLARFISWQLRGGAPLLKEGTLAEMYRVAWLHDDWKSGQGLGFLVQRQGRATVVGHWGWLAGFQTRIALCPAEKVGVIVLTNADDGTPDIFVEQVFALVVPALRRSNHQGGATPRDVPEWRRAVAGH